jgi:hypothetical protein
LLFPYAILINPVTASLVGMVNVNVPAVIDCDPKVNTATSFLFVDAAL